MAKRPGSKSSRSERRAGKERARRAREHGLPERREPAPLRARAATPEPGSFREGDDRSSDAPPAPPRKQLIPTPLKLLGIAVVILIGVYVLSQKRDEALSEKPTAEAPSASASAEQSPAPTTEATTAEPVAPAASATTPPPAEPIADVAPPPAASVVEPSVAAPSVSAPSKPKVARPVVVVPPAPAPAAAPAPVAAPAAPAPVATPAAPKPAAPPAAPARATQKPADNPY